MKKFRLLAVLLVTAASLPPASRAETQMRPISEKAARAASDNLYSEILNRACRNGWRYSRASIENGFRRHFEEFKAALVAQGYVIVPDDAPAPPVATTPVAAGEFSGCSGPYWLKE